MNANSPVKAGRREWLGLAVLALPTILIALDMTVLHLAVPHLSADLAPSGTQLLWIVDIYGFLIAGMLIAMGTLGDRLGRRTLLLIGAAAFAAASIFAAFSTSAELLITARALLGVAGATLMPSTMSLISTMFQDDRQRTVAISVWLSCFTGGTAIGPLVGGLMLEFFWWGSVFLLAVPVMVLLLVLGPILLPEYRNPSPGRLKLGSVAMLLIATLMLVYALKRFAELGLNTLPVLFLVGGLVIGFVFVQRQRRLAEPLLDMRLFAGRAFSASLATMTLAIFAMAGAAFFLQQYLQMVAGLSPFQAGLVGLPIPIMMIISTMLTPALARRVQPAVLMATGLVIASVGLALLMLATPDSGFTILVVGGVVQALGLGPTLALGTDMIIGSAPTEKAGAASAISETGAEMGTALGIAVLGSIGTAVYRSDVADQVPPGVPDGIAQAARDTVGAAVSAAGNLPERLGEPLLAAAREAFTHGLQVAAGVAAGTTLGIAVLAAILLRGVRPSSGYEQAEAAGTEDGGGSDDGSGADSGDGARGARGVEEQALQRD